MAAIKINGSETFNNLEDIASIQAQAAMVTTPVASGSRAWSYDYTPTDPRAEVGYKTLACTTDKFFHIRVRISATPAATVVVLRIGTGGTNKRAIRINTSGQVEIFDYTNGVLVTSSTVLSVNTYYRIEAQLDWTVGSPNDELKINGTSEGSSTGGSTSASSGLNPLILGDDQKGDTKSNCIVYTDDFVIFDTSGSVNNSWVGDVKVLGAVPIGQSPDSGYDDFTGSPDATNKYNNWDERGNDGDTSYNQGPAGAPPWEQLSTIQSSSTIGLASGDTIVAVATKVVANLNNAQTNTGTILVRDNGTNYATDFVLNVDNLYYVYERIDDQAPRGSAWTQAIFDAFQIGAQIGSDQTSGAAHRFTQVTAQVAYTPAASQIKKVSGVAQASIKKISDVAIVSVKKISGVSNV